MQTNHTSLNIQKIVRALFNSCQSTSPRNGARDKRSLSRLAHIPNLGLLPVSLRVLNPSLLPAAHELEQRRMTAVSPTMSCLLLTCAWEQQLDRKQLYIRTHHAIRTRR